MTKIITAFLATARIARSHVKRKLVSVLKDTSSGLWVKIQKKAVHGEPGDRLFPKQISILGQTYGIRFDLGEKFQKPVGKKMFYFRSVILQINKNPTDRALKEAAEKYGTHAKRIRFEIPLNEKGDTLHEDLTSKDIDDLIDDLGEKGV